MEVFKFDSISSYSVTLDVETDTSVDHEALWFMSLNLTHPVYMVKLNREMVYDNQDN